MIKWMMSVLFLGILAQAQISNISFEEIKKQNGLMVDVRSIEEVRTGIVEGAAWFPLTAMKENPAEETTKLVQFAKGRPLFIYCRSGRRSQEYVDLLKGQNVKATNIGGFEDLKKRGFPSADFVE